MKRRKQIHENIGKAIEEIYAERLEEFYEMLAYHYSKSDNLEKAFEYLKLSGDKAWSNYANEESYNYYVEAIKVLRQLPDTDENKKLELLVTLSIFNPMYFIGFPEDSLSFLQKGERLAKELDDKISLAAFYTFIGRYYLYKSDPLESIRYIEPLFHEAKRNHDIDLMVILSYGLLSSYTVCGNYSKILDITLELIQLIEEVNRQSESFGLPHNVYSWLCSIYGMTEALIGNFEEGKRYIEKGLSFAVEIDDVVSIGVIEWHYGAYYLLKSDGKKTIEHALESIKYNEETNFPLVIGTSWCNSGSGYYYLGDLETALKHTEKGFNIQKNTPVTMLLSSYPLCLSYIYHDSGDLNKAQSCAEEALELSMKNNERSNEGQSRVSLGKILGKMDASKRAEAEEYILQGIKILEELKVRPYILRAYFFLGELYANTGRREEALVNLNKALSMNQEMGIEYWPDKIQEVLDRL